MPRKPKAVPLSKVEDIQSSLKQKAASPKTISLDELVKTLAQPIQDMLDAGYDYSDVAEVFQGHGIELAASGIKNFHKKALTAVAHKSGDNSLESSDESTSQEIADGDGSSSSLPSTTEQSDDSKNKTTKRKKTTAKESEEKPEHPSYPNRLTFVPKIYSDDEI
ncbi:hypothetical protein [Nostoc sp. FACHB-190]|uniref:hypothetical protein n=1 Tax=Nostoc sp. FACHB-190 TaxID=2692838 RepID=UPI0016867DED|nr:hypothetical protein [Nostoc sp. FACHB-190]MBD2303810.1 hypothetical protein [Nostoc sp. FACHB-190]